MRETKCAGGVVVNPNGQVVVVSNRRDSWSLPKGHIKKKEDALLAAEREIEEETGLRDLVFVKELGTYERFKNGLQGAEDTTELKTITLFLFKTNQTSLRPQGADNPEARWVAIEDVVPLLTSQKDKEFFESVIEEIKKIST
ncbi:MAG: NUDIX domain-containing protein [Candidatus Magasanikbacteria bacterium]|nr:NUDIX domain-containing protein [Candidatus Magasanikbacteria bacterium]